jgi:hypothetical protein
MVFLLLFVIVIATAVAISIFRLNISVGSGVGREDSRIARRAGQSSVAGPVKQFLVVVLPDGTIVTQSVGGQV